MIYVTVFSFIAFVLSFLGASVLGNVVIFIVGLLSTMASIYIAYVVVLGINDIEYANNCDLNSKELYTHWKALAIITSIGYVLVFISVFMVPCFIIAFAAIISFLLAFNKTNKRYNQLLL